MKRGPGELWGHGGEIYGRKVLCDFSACVSPLGLPPLAKAAAVKALDSSGDYPDPECRDLKKAIGEAHHLAPETILPGNGAAELIFALCFGIRPARVLAPVPGFSEYRRAAFAAGCEVQEILRSAETGFRIPEELAAEIPIRKSQEGETLLFLTNPDHPAGKVTKRQQLLDIASACEEQGIWFCLDESFLPFLKEEEEQTLLGESFPHLIVLRAFTKIYAMAGLRLGYLYSENASLLEKVRSVLQPWNVSIPAQMAGIAALKDRAYLDEVRDLVCRERAFLKAELESRGESGGEALAKEVFGGQANFLFFRAEAGLEEKLLGRGILIRSFENDAGLGPGYYRIAVRTREENERLLRAWREARQGVSSHG